jgi:hypothetical protein
LSKEEDDEEDDPPPPPQAYRPMTNIKTKTNHNLRFMRKIKKLLGWLIGESINLRKDEGGFCNARRLRQFFEWQYPILPGNPATISNPPRLRPVALRPILWDGLPFSSNFEYYFTSNLIACQVSSAFGSGLF